MARPTRLALSVCWVFLLTGCSTVRYSRVRDDYAQVDRQKTKRLSVVTQPLPENKPELGTLMSRMAKRYVNQKRNFIAKSEHADAKATVEVAALCVEGIEGVLWLKPAVTRKGNGVEAQVDGVLLRCSDGQEVWAASAAGSWRSDDKTLKELTALYVAELGEDVRPYVAPMFRVLKAALDTLPDPVLNDEDVSEKIELGE